MDSHKQHIKIVLPCANEGKWLRVTVDSILENTEYPDYEIVISANGDTLTDFSFLDAKQYEEKVTLITSQELLGVGAARNAGVWPGDARFYVFLDAHSLISQPDWLDRGIECLEENPTASMVQPEIVNFFHDEDPTPPLELDKLSINHSEYATRWAWPVDEAARLTDTIYQVEGSEVQEAMSGSGGAVFALADTFHRLGGFDSQVRGWFHETLDYCTRAWLVGCPMLINPQIQVYHRTKRQLTTPRSLEHVYEGMLRTAYKYLSPRRRDLAENLTRQHVPEEADAILGRVRQGPWLAERIAHAAQKTHDDDWLFSRFDVVEGRFAGSG